MSQICRDPKTGKPGLVPWVPRTWLKRVGKGEIPPGRKIGGKTRVWTIEEVLAVGSGLLVTPADAAGCDPERRRIQAVITSCLTGLILVSAGRARFCAWTRS